MKAKVLIYDVKARTLKEEEREVEEIPIETRGVSIDFKELAQVIEDVKRIKEKLGLK